MADQPAGALTARIDRLDDVLSVADGVLSTPMIVRGETIIENASSRLRHGTAHTVVALAGATGSGKSSLFNALVGEELAPVGIMRPTTSEARAAVFGDDDAASLLDWLGVRHRHGLPGGDLEGLVLIDLPDHDSVEVTHRMQVDRFVQIVDTLVWVLDPQKYADQVLHQRYLEPLAGHVDVMVFVLHQSDLVPATERETLAKDARRLLTDDGLIDPIVLETSLVSGEGIDDLRSLVAERITSRTAALERIDADLVGIATEMEELRLPELAGPTEATEKQLVADLADAAGAEGLADVVGEAYRHRARIHTGWPYSRWIARMRRNPLGDYAGIDASGKPAAAPIDHARLDLALKTAADGSAGDLPPVWLRKVRTAASSRHDELSSDMSRSVTSVVGVETDSSRWWSVGSVLQNLFALIALGGALWLVALLALEWLRVPTETVTPEVNGWPVPTLMLIGGIVVGLLLTWIFGLVAAGGARRRARRVRSQIRERLAAPAQEHVVLPITSELDRLARLGDDLDVIAGTVAP